MLSIILSSRFKGNPDNNMHQFLSSLIACGANKDNCEVLIKLDNDDFEYVKDISIYEQYNLNIRLFTYERGEGRYELHNFYNYLFLNRSAKSRFILTGSDDFKFTRFNFINNILENKDKYCCVGYWRGTPLRLLANNVDNNYSCIYCNKNCDMSYKHSGSSLPCLSTDLVNVISNFGYHSNIDNWATLINIIMYKKYKINLFKNIQPFYNRTVNTNNIMNKPNLYSNIVVGGYNNSAHNKYYIQLVEQQCKNLYLNKVADSMMGCL